MTGEFPPTPAPSVDKIRRRLIERIEAVTNIDALLAFEVVLSQLDFPYEPESAVEGFLTLGDMVRASRLLHDALNEPGGEEPS